MSENYPVSSWDRKTVDQVGLFRGLIVSLLIVLTVLFGFLTVKMGNPILMAGLLILPFALMLMRYPGAVLVLAFVMDASGISIPGLSFTTAGLLAKLLLIGIFLLSVAVGQRQWSAAELPERRPLILFTLVVILLMAVRGSGLRILGSTTWGGMAYINIFIGIIFFITINGLKVTQRQITWMAIGGLGLSAVGSLFKSQGWAEAAEYSAVMSSRIRWVYDFAIALLPVALGCCSKKNKLLSFTLVTGAVVLLLLTGDRKLLIVSVITLSGFGFFRAAHKTFYVVKVLIIGLFALIIIALGARSLPLGIQRSIAVVPGISVDYRVSRDAEGSSDWRIEIWKYCLKEAPQYLLIGRGSAFDVHDASGQLSSSDIGTFTPWFAYITRSYHSGPLSLLIDYSIFGLVAMLWFTNLLFRRLWRYCRQLSSIDTFQARFALALCVLLMAFLFKYYFIMGGIVEWPNFFSKYALVIVIVSSILQNKDAVEKEFLKSNKVLKV